MEGLGIGGAVFFLKTPKKVEKQITQIYYDKGQAVIIEPNTPRWNELMGRFKLSEFFLSPELWSAAQSIRELREELFKDKDKIRIVVKRTVEGFGDVIMMTVIPKAFKEAFGNDVDVDVFVDPSFVQLLEGNPYIDKILIQEFDEKKYDLVLNANSIDFKTETKENEIEQKCRRNRTNLYLQQLGLWLIDRTPVYVVSEKEKKWARDFLGGMSRPIIAVQMEASVISKTYPHMQKVVEDLIGSRYGVIVLDERHPDGKYMYTLRQMAALINESDIVVAPDSLALHLAGALKKRGVGIFGYTDGEIITQDYEKIHPFQAVCPYKKAPCWWTIDCLEGDSTREKEIAGHCHCLEQLEHNWILAAIEAQRGWWSEPPVFLTMLTYNLLNMTKKAIASIKSKHNYKLMVVDNESTDGTQEWLKEQGISFVSKKSSVSEAQNIAMTEFLTGDGKYFIFLNNDIVLRMDYIDELIAAQKRTGAWGLVGSITRSVPAWAIDDIKITDKWDKECIDIPAGSYSATLLTRKCIEKVGFFDEQYTPRYIEDNDYTLRIRLSGGSFFLTNYAQFFHVLGATVKSHPEEMKRYGERWDKNIAKFKTKFGIHPHEAQDLKKLGLEWYSVIYSKMPIDVMDEAASRAERFGVLVQRNMGGFGDIIFTTIVAKALKERYGSKIQVDYAVPKKFERVLVGNPNINKIHEFGHQNGVYRFVVELTDLEYRVELNEIQKYGEVRTPRTQIYLDVLGIKDCSTIKPDYFVLSDEMKWAKDWWGEGSPKVVVIQKGSNLLKVWPGMNDLVSRLKGRVVFLDKLGVDFRKAGALVATADYVVSPDTGISNLAGALDIPVITIFGNRNGKVFEQMYDSMISVQGNCPYSYQYKDYCDFKTPCFGDAPHRQKENIDVPECLKRLKVEEVYKEVREILDK